MQTQVPAQGEALTEGDTVGAPLALALTGEALLEGERLGETGEGLTLPVGEGVPLQMQTPFSGEPQLVRQQRSTQGVTLAVGDSVAVALGVALDEAVAEGVPVGGMLTLGETLAVSEGVGGVRVGEALTEALTLGESERQAHWMLGQLPVQVQVPAQGEEEMVGEKEREGETLGVPLQMHSPSAGAPQLW